MAIPPPDVMKESWVRDAFLRDLQDHYRPTFVDDWFRERLPTEASIKADVAKLRSVSDAGRAWIADRRMAVASVGPWKDTFVIRRKGEGYPAIICKARQEGWTYKTELRDLKI